MRRCSERSHATLQIDLAIKLLDEIDSLEPPVSEQLRIEWNSNELGATSLNGVTDSAQQSREMLCVSLNLCVSLVGLVCLLVTEIRCLRGDTPQLEAARIPDLVELEVRTI